VSAVTGDGVRRVLGELANLVREARTEEAPEPSIVVLRPVPEGTRIEKIDAEEFRLHGRDVERAVALNDVTTPDALNYIEERLKHLGVLRMLARAGVVEGATVHIGEFSFDYTPEK
jgi:GTP-binding protein